MTLFEELEQKAVLQHEQGDFPSWLLADILEITADPDRYAGKEQIVETLIMQIQGYDPYAGSGCFDTSFSAEDIRRTVRRICT